MGFQIFGTAHLLPRPEENDVTTAVYTTETPKPKPRNTREAVDRIAARHGWDLEAEGVKECRHHWSRYRIGPYTIRVEWTYKLHIRGATLRFNGDRSQEEAAPTMDTIVRSHNARFSWVADLMYQLGDV